MQKLSVSCFCALKNGNCENMFVCIFIFEKLHFAIVLLCCCVLKMEAVKKIHVSSCFQNNKNSKTWLRFLVF